MVLSFRREQSNNQGKQEAASEEEKELSIPSFPQIHSQESLSTVLTHSLHFFRHEFPFV